MTREKKKDNKIERARVGCKYCKDKNHHAHLPGFGSVGGDDRVDSQFVGQILEGLYRRSFHFVVVCHRLSWISSCKRVNGYKWTADDRLWNDRLGRRAYKKWNRYGRTRADARARIMVWCWWLRQRLQRVRRRWTMIRKKTFE